LGDRVAVGVDRRGGEVVLEVEQHQLGGLTDQRRRLRRVVDAGKLDHDLVLALLADLRLGHAELVDAALHDRDRPVEVGRGERVALRRHRLEHDLETALEVEAEDRLLVKRRAGHGEQERADEGGHDRAHE